MRGLFENWRRRCKSDVAPCPKSAPDSDSRYLFGGDFGGATEAVKVAGGRPPAPRPNNGLATRPHIGERPRASRIVQALGLDQPSITQYHRSTRPPIEPA